jgi:hypothetical protein
METEQVPEQIRELASTLAKPRRMRRGSLSERFVKCNKAGCPCAKDPAARHGPYWSWSRVVDGKTQSRWVPAEEVAELRSQLESGQEFRRVVEAYWQASEAWAIEHQSEPSEAAPQDGAAKKRASKRTSTPRSSPKSRG